MSSNKAGDKIGTTLELSTGLERFAKLLYLGVRASEGLDPMLFRGLSD